MAYPMIFASHFDTGDIGDWDTETDVSGVLDYPHYTTLASLVGRPMPYRGAYCMRIVAPANTADHTLLEGDMNVAAGVTGWTRFMLYVSTDFAATADDIFNIFELQAGGTVEGAISLQITGATDLVEIGIGETAASTFNSYVSKGVWHQVELRALVDSGGGNDGVLELFLDGASIQTVSTLDQGAITDGVLGTQNTLSTTDAGYLLFDEFAFDNTRLFIPHRFATHRVILDDAFLFVGPGRIDNVKILDGGSGDVILDLYDTDVYAASLQPIWHGRTATANVDVDAADVPIDVTRGCLARFTAGTLPGAQFAIGSAVGWGSDGALRSYAASRKLAPANL